MSVRVALGHMGSNLQFDILLLQPLCFIPRSLQFANFFQELFFDLLMLVQGLRQRRELSQKAN